MAYLLDTHTLVYFGEGKNLLSKKARQIISDQDGLFVSIASLWEIAIKNSLGKLPLSGEFDEIPEFLKINDIQILNLDFKDLSHVKNLPFVHRDPFDRILVAQTQRTGYTLITKDQKLSKYGIATLW